MPLPICIDSILLYPHNLAPKPHPIIFVRTATIINAIVTITISPFKYGSFTFNPTLAKNTGDNNIYDNVSNLFVIYIVSLLDESTSPAIYAPVISATPKNFSALNDSNKHITKDTITNLLLSMSYLSTHLLNNL